LEEEIAERKQAEELLEQKNNELVAAYTALRNIQTQIIHQEKMASIGQLAAGVSHEINNPTSFVISNLDSLQKYMIKISSYLATQEKLLAEMAGNYEQGEKEKAAGLYNRIKEIKQTLKIDYIMSDTEELVKETLEGALRVNNIVQDLKGFAKIKDEVTLADINDGLESTINIIHNEIKYKATLFKELGDIPRVSCNLSQINQVFMSILINAVQSMNVSGEIRVKTWCEKNKVFISIADTGSGMPPEIINRIFEPFFTTKEPGSGTGLGLSVSYDIVRKHGGEIHVESEVGIGSVFTIIIPVM